MASRAVMPMQFVVVVVVVVVIRSIIKQQLAYQTSNNNSQQSCSKWPLAENRSLYLDSGRVKQAVSFNFRFLLYETDPKKSRN